jgi:hypothetical protein
VGKAKECPLIDTTEGSSFGRICERKVFWNGICWTNTAQDLSLKHLRVAMKDPVCRSQNCQNKSHQLPIIIMKITVK